MGRRGVSQKAGILVALVWTNDGKFTDAYMRHTASMSFNQGVGGVI